MTRRDDDFTIKTIVFVITLAMFELSMSFIVSTVTYTDDLKIYSATLPFGVFSVKGEIDGVYLFVAGSVSGSISGAEIYSIKYLEGGQLKTLILDAEATPLIVDGTMIVERSHDRVGKIGGVSYMLGNRTPTRFENSSYTYKIHIPYLPEHEPLTDDWSK